MSHAVHCRLGSKRQLLTDAGSTRCRKVHLQCAVDGLTVFTLWLRSVRAPCEAGNYTLYAVINNTWWPVLHVQAAYLPVQLHVLLDFGQRLAVEVNNCYTKKILLCIVHDLPHTCVHSTFLYVLIGSAASCSLCQLSIAT